MPPTGPICPDGPVAPIAPGGRAGPDGADGPYGLHGGYAPETPAIHYPHRINYDVCSTFDRKVHK